MRPILTAAQMREADRITIEEGLPGLALMENAGAAVAAAIEERYPLCRRPLVLCGKGNNGGDGFVVARLLAARGAAAVLLGKRSDVVGSDAAAQLQAFVASGGELREVPDEDAWAEVTDLLRGADLLVDALAGTGLRNAPTGLFAIAVQALLARHAAGVPVVAVDLPSGLPSDTGELSWPAVVADLTVTFGAPKLGHVLPPSCNQVGALAVADIGIAEETLERARPAIWLLEERDAAEAFRPRGPGSHKGDFGHVLVVGGSVGKAGAAILAATAALRAGAGLVTVACPEPVLTTVAGGRPEAMTEPLPATSGGRVSAEAVERALALAATRDAVVLGPGLGLDAGVRAFVREFLAACPRPVVVDADGLNALVADAGGPMAPIRRDAATVLTPHPGEAGRLLGEASSDVQRRRLAAARALADGTGAMIVLKGQSTLVVEPAGRVAVNPTGGPALATAGSGDVLAGVMGALVARVAPWLAATASVFVHGRAGDLAAARLGDVSVLAGDVIEALPDAIQSLAGAGKGRRR